MGYGAWNSASYTMDSAVYRSQTREEIFQSHTINKDFDPQGVVMRESFDSPESPESTAVIVAFDVTGSMGFMPEHMVKHSLGTLVEGLLDQQPITNPHIMMMAVGDITCDEAPLQVTQFEADNRISDQLTELWLEGGGGGNSYESYDLPWAFAASRTNIDCWSKRNKKGYLFTIGDENFPRTASKERLNDTIGEKLSQRVEAEDLLAAAQEKYNVFHLLVEEGYHARNWYDETVDSWKVLGKHVILLDNYKYLSEVILSVIRVNEGEHPEEVAKSWQEEAARKAVKYSLNI